MVPTPLINPRQRMLSAVRDAIDFMYFSLARRMRVIFVVTDGCGFACQAPVIRALLQYHNISVHTTQEKSRTNSEIEFASENDRVFFKTLFVAPAHARFQKWHLVIDTHRNGFYPAFNTLRAYMHHGPGFGNSGPKVWPAERSNIFFGLSEAEYSYIESIKPGTFKDKRLFFPVGFPKSDALYQGTYDRQQVLAELGLPDRFTILISSHWQKWGLLRCLNENPLVELARTFQDCNIIQTGHNWLWNDQHAVPPNWRNQIINSMHEAERRFSNVRFVPTPEVERLLAVADLLVSDSSSVTSTYSLLDRPIVFFDTPGANFVSPELKSIFLNASHGFSTIDELVPACRAALSFPTEKATGRSTMRQTFFTNEGQSAERMAKLIHSFAPLYGCINRDRERLLSMTLSPSIPDNAGRVVADI